MAWPCDRSGTPTANDELGCVGLFGHFDFARSSHSFRLVLTQCPQWIEENSQRRTSDDGRKIRMKVIDGKLCCALQGQKNSSEFGSAMRCGLVLLLILLEEKSNCQPGNGVSKKKRNKNREREHHLSLHKHVDLCRLAVPFFSSKDNTVWFSMSVVVDL
ncbi:unnamed protein product [Sphenostylis stenocarpa]|uniref:Uncharacterized protein n=1 Tax=Sphenostylis stenocarpa TaxID=92480 RepID=A0AA87B9S1_9FABA|nr:unnamed protein product [Sphenostylis stenocarpa]